MDTQKINGYKPNFQAMIIVREPQAQNLARKSLNCAREQVHALTEIIERERDRYTAINVTASSHLLSARNQRNQKTINVMLGKGEDAKYAYLNLLTRIADNTSKKGKEFWG